MNFSKHVRVKIEEFRNLNNLNFKFVGNETTIIIGENNVGKTNLLDYINIHYKENHTGYDVFHNNSDKDIFSYLTNQIIKVRINKIFSFRLIKDNAFLSCREHKVFEAKVEMFGKKISIDIHYCDKKNWYFCDLRNYPLLDNSKYKVEETKKVDSLFYFKYFKEQLELALYSFFELGNKVGNYNLSFHWSLVKKTTSYELGEFDIEEKWKLNKWFDREILLKFSFRDIWDGKQKKPSSSVLRMISLEITKKILKIKNKDLVGTLISGNKWRLFYKDLKNNLLLIDEPELSLTPFLVKDVANSIKKLTSIENTTAILITHSPILLSCFDFLGKEINLVLMKKYGKKKLFYLKAFMNNRSVKKTILEEYKSYADKHRKQVKNDKCFYKNKWKELLNELTLKLFFSKRVLFVEGPTDLSFFNKCLKDITKDLNKHLFRILNWCDEEIKKLKEQLKSDEKKEEILWRLNSQRENVKNELNSNDEWLEDLENVDIIPISGKYNYIFFSKLSKYFEIPHIFLLDDDSHATEKEHLNFYKKQKKKKNIIWIEEKLENFLGIKENPHQLGKVHNVISRIKEIVRNLKKEGGYEKVRKMKRWVSMLRYANFFSSRNDDEKE